MAALPETLAAGRLATSGGSHPRAFARNAFPFLVLGGMWEIVAHLGIFPLKLFPPIEAIAAALYRLTVSGILPLQAADTLLRLGAGFALAADMALLTLGGALKRKEMLSARLGDILAELYLLSAALKRWEDEGRQVADLPLLEWCMRNGFNTKKASSAPSQSNTIATMKMGIQLPVAA